MRFEVVPTAPNPGNMWFGALGPGLGGAAESPKFAMLGVHEGDPVWTEIGRFGALPNTVCDFDESKAETVC